MSATSDVRVPPGSASALNALPTGPSCAAGPPIKAPELDVTVLRLLADPLRVQIVQLLAAEQLCTCHLVGITGARQTNISDHLRALREAGLVQQEHCGRFTYYQLDPGALEALGGALTALAATARSAPGRRRPC